MKIFSLDLKNYRQFLRHTTMAFSTDPVRKVTIIEGACGSGKSTLLQALKWCLYGNEYVDSRQNLSSDDSKLIVGHAVEEFFIIAVVCFVPVGFIVRIRFLSIAFATVPCKYKLVGVESVCQRQNLLEKDKDNFRSHLICR